MALTVSTPQTLLGGLLPQTGRARLAANVAIVVAGSLLLALSAQIKVPVMPVPVTLTTLTIALLAAGFGWRIGVATVALYIAQGLSGLPVFANGGGIGYLFSPSFGFIVGYLAMAYVIGRFASAKGTGTLVTFLVMLAGDAVAFAFGFAWLLGVASMIVSSGAALPGWLDAGNLMMTAFDGAIRPFIVWDVLKMAFAAISVAGLGLALRRRG